MIEGFVYCGILLKDEFINTKNGMEWNVTVNKLNLPLDEF